MPLIDNNRLNDIPNDEVLVRLIYSPEHLVDNDELKPTFIPSQDIIDRGLSVNRKRLIRREYIEQSIQKYLQKSADRKFHGYALVSCNEVLKITDHEGKTAFCVKPDPIEDNEAHAVILCTKKYSRSVVSMVREKLIKKFYIIKELEKVLS